MPDMTPPDEEARVGDEALEPTAAEITAFREWFFKHTGKRIFHSNARKAVETIAAARLRSAPVQAQVVEALRRIAQDVHCHREGIWRGRIALASSNGVEGYPSFTWDDLAALSAHDQGGEATVPCETCCGNGEIVTDWERYLGPAQPNDEGDEGTADCPDCDGTGRVASPPPAVDAGVVERVAQVIVDMTGAGTLGTTNEASLRAARNIVPAILAALSPARVPEALPDHEPIEIGDIGNYYGGLSLKREGGVDYWSIGNYDGEDWQVVPRFVADALRAFTARPAAPTPARKGEG